MTNKEIIEQTIQTANLVAGEMGCRIDVVEWKNDFTAILTVINIENVPEISTGQRARFTLLSSAAKLVWEFQDVSGAPEFVVDPIKCIKWSGPPKYLFNLLYL